MSEKNDENRISIHSSHRKRLKSRVLNEGISNFEPHAVLEFLLFYSIPQGDTNPLAHKLIKQFGSLENVLNASYSDLVAVQGVGEHTAVFISFLRELIQEYMNRMTVFEPQKSIISSNQLKNKFIARLRYLCDEELHILCLSSDMKVLYFGCLFRGNVNKIDINIRKIVETALFHRASNVVIAHNHPSESAEPSPYDDNVTLAIMRALSYSNIALADHLIVSKFDCYSFLEHGDINRYLAIIQKENSDTINAVDPKAKRTEPLGPSEVFRFRVPKQSIVNITQDDCSSDEQDDDCDEPTDVFDNVNWIDD